MREVAETIFNPLLIASRDAAILALAVGGILLLLKNRIPAACRHLLWLLVALRLVLPALPASPVSWQVLLPGPATPPQAIPKEAIPASKTPPVSDLSTIPLPSKTVVTKRAVNNEPRQAVAPTPSKSSSFSVRETLSIIWLMGVLILISISGILLFRFRKRLRRLTVTDHPREKSIRKMLSALASEFRVSRTPKIRVSDVVSAPALSGLFRPEILIPSRSLENLDDSQLRFVLLHELAHFRRHDLWVNLALAVIKTVHWFNPFVWWAFHQARIEAESATDAVVLKHCGAEQSTEYGEALLQILEVDENRRGSLPGVVGVLENRKDLRSRLRAIGRFTGQHNRLAILASALLILGLAAAGLTQAPNPDANNDAQSSGEEKPVTIQVIERVSGEPVSGATVRLVSKDESWSAEKMTGKNGEITFAPAKDFSTFKAFAHQEGFTSNWTWIKPPKEFIFRLDPVITIGGVVTNRKGEPVPDAGIEVSWFLRQDDIPKADYQWGLDDPEDPIRTDKEGKWSYPLAPKGFSLNPVSGGIDAPYPLRVKIKHRKYAPSEMRLEAESQNDALLAGTAKTELVHALEVSGILTDEKGAPIPDAFISEIISLGGESKTEKSGADGKFSIFLEAGNHRLLFSRKGFAGLLREIPLSEVAAPLDLGKITLRKAEPLTIRIVSDSGKPVSDVRFVIEHHADRRFSGHANLANLYTDENGEAVWNSPMEPEAWLYTCLKQNYFTLRDRKPKWEDNTLEVTLPRAIQISGKITDAKTGKPITKYKLVRGQRMRDGSTHWHQDSARFTINREGKFSYRIDDAKDPVFRVEADGFLPQSSDDYPADIEERNHQQDFVLQPAETAPGLQVLQPDGKTPAAGASLILKSGSSRNLSFIDLKKAYPNSRDPEPVEADKEGKLDLSDLSSPPHDGYIVHKSGYVRIDTDSLKGTSGKTIQLSPFASVKGSLSLDGNPAAGRTLEIQSSIKHPHQEDRYDFWIVNAKAGPGGKFSSEALIPGEQVYRIFLVDEITGEKSAEPIATTELTPGNITSVEVEFSTANQVNLRGRFVTADGGSMESTPYLLANIYLSRYVGTERFHYNIRPAKDGTFTTIPATPGKYRVVGDFQFRNGQTVRYQEDWLIPVNAIEKAEDGIYSVGDKPINYPIKKSPPPNKKLPPGQVEIRVIDDQTEKPIPGVTITPWGLANSGSADIGWREGEEKVDPEAVITNEQGIAVIRYPEKFTREKILNHSDKAVSFVRLRLQHPDYLGRPMENLPVDGSAEPMRLQRGAVQKITPTLNEDMQLVEENLSVHVSDPEQTMEGHDWKWEESTGSKDKTIFHRNIPAGDHVVCTVYRIGRGDFLSSEPELITFESGKTVTKNYTLKRGAPFRGKLDPAIPRPVKDGWITVYVAPISGEWDNLYGPIRIDETMKVDENGQFHFPSLPDGRITVVAGADGWANQVSSLDMFSTELTIPSEDRESAVVKMNPTGSIRITVLSPNGKPLRGAKVSMSPNQRIPAVGNTFYGANRVFGKFEAGRNHNKDLSLEERRDFWMEHLMSYVQQWSAETDENGTATISNLPYANSETIHIEYPGLQIPMDKHRQRFAQTKIKPGETVELTQKLEGQ